MKIDSIQNTKLKLEKIKKNVPIISEKDLLRPYMPVSLSDVNKAALTRLE